MSGEKSDVKMRPASKGLPRAIAARDVRAGQWVEEGLGRDAVRMLCVFNEKIDGYIQKDPDYKYEVGFVELDEEGVVTANELRLVPESKVFVLLPDCTSWDWESPTLAPEVEQEAKAGCELLRQINEIVGDMDIVIKLPAEYVDKISSAAVKAISELTAAIVKRVTR